MRFPFLPLLLAAVLLGGCADGPDAAPHADAANAVASIPFDKEGTLTFERLGTPYLTIDIEIADTDSTRARGLMQRTSLPEQSGMLFIFPDAEPRSFWMANTQMSLDIIFVGPDQEILNIEKYTRPLSPENVSSIGAARYVVEVPAGFTDTHGITESDRIDWSVE